MLTLREVATFTRGRLVPARDGDAGDVGSLEIDSVATDSRALASRSALFVALAGERFDAHAFVDEAAVVGAARAVVVDARHGPARLPSIAVDDTRRALGDLAAGWRARFDLPLIAVTGSNGKTTTKEMIAAILAAAFGDDDRLATRGNLNNDVGVPLTLFDLRSRHRAAVVELGMNHPGETARLAAIAAPTVALVVNAQREHQEFMQSVDAVADEHALAIAALAADGVAVFPADDAYADVWRRAAGARRVVDFVCNTGQEAGPGAAVVGRAYLEVEDTILHIDAAGATITIRLAVPGLHNARNATAAAAACIAAGVGLDAVVRGLEAFRPMRGRSQRRAAANGVVVIDDSYNANPDSMRAAIDLLAAYPAPRLLVMGDMGEVGTDGPRFHAEVGRHARERGIDALYAIGAASRDAATAFGGAARHFDAIDALVTAVTSWVDAAMGGAIVVKGSRFMRMERVADALDPALAPARAEELH